MKTTNIRFFGYLGLTASIMVGIGEFLLHFPPAITTVPFNFFLAIPENWLTIGHWILVPFVPLYIFGYWHIYLALKPGSKNLATAVLVLGIFAFMIGGMWVSSRAHLGFTVHTLAEINDPEIHTKIINSYTLHIENLVQLLRVLVLLISICFVMAILNGGTLYPKWVAIFNPICLLAIVFVLFFYVNPIGKFLIPTAMNVAHFVLFSVSLLALKKNT